MEIELSGMLKKIAMSAKVLERDIKKEVNGAINKACSTMLKEAKKHTPHKGDGKKRGINMITNELQSSWRIRKKTKGGVICGVTLVNDKEYAKFVQYGHKLTRHFVPWLYIDGNVISRSLKRGSKLFGIVVGTKTSHVEGIDMTGPAVEAFNKTLEKSINDVFKKLAVKSLI